MDVRDWTSSAREAIREAVFATSFVTLPVVNREFWPNQRGWFPSGGKGGGKWGGRADIRGPARPAPAPMQAGQHGRKRRCVCEEG